MKNLFYYLENDKTAVLFHNESMNFYRVYDEKIKNYLKSFFIEGKYSRETENILNDLLIEINKEMEIKRKSENKNIGKRILTKLVLMVTNDCNLRCKYCYAKGGSYGLSINYMTITEAKNILDYFTKNFERINVIQIFGGEPLLNYKVIKFICEYFKFLNTSGFINYMPRFAIVTNGTYFSNEIIDLMKDYDLFKFFREKFGSYITHITPVCIQSDNSLSLNNFSLIVEEYTKEAVEYTFETMLNEKIVNSSTIITAVIDRLINKTPILYICPAGVETLSVRWDGNIYPCFMFTGSNMYVGNLSSESEEIISNVKSFVLKYNKKDLDSICANCWAKYVCSLCLGSFGEDINNKDKSYGADIMCIMIQTIIKNILLKLAEIKASQEKWQIVQEVIQRHSRKIGKIY